MIFPKPTEEQIRSAHVITFYDPKRPEFHRVIYDTVDRTKQPPKDLLVVDIPVDSQNGEAIVRLLDWVESIRTPAGH
jgi:hypothetical protein